MMKIESIGYHLPPSKKLASIIDQFPKNWQYPIHKKAGIESIRKARPGEYSLCLAKEAVKKCLALSKYQANDLDVIISCNICKYDAENMVTIEPSTAASIAKFLNAEQARCFDINNACAGMFTGIHIAKSMIASKTASRILVFSGEFISPLGDTVFQESKSGSEYPLEDMVASLTLGDSAVAMVLEASNTETGFVDVQMKTYGEHSDLCVAFPTMNGPLMLTKSRELAQRASIYSAEHTSKILCEKRWESQPIRFLIPHQTAEKVIKKSAPLVRRRDGTSFFNETNTLINVKTRGNTSTTTHFVAMMDKILKGEVKKGDKLVFSISASGITIGTALYIMDDLPERIKNFQGAKKEQIKELTTIKRGEAFIRDIAIVKNQKKNSADTFSMTSQIIRKILKNRKVSNNKIGLLIFTGNYVSENITEPAIASMLLKKARIDEELYKAHFSDDLFCFDLKNGAIGTSSAIEIAQNLMCHHKLDEALIISSEISQPSLDQSSYFPVETMASGLLLQRENEHQCIQLINNKFYNFWEYEKAYKVGVSWANSSVGLDYFQCECLEEKYMESISEALKQFFRQTNTTWEDYDCIAIPNLGNSFQDQFYEKYKNLEREKFLPIQSEKDAFTSQLAETLSKFSRQYKKAKRVLNIQVASGLQVNLSSWSTSDNEH